MTVAGQVRHAREFRDGMNLLPMPPPVGDHEGGSVGIKMFHLHRSTEADLPTSDSRMISHGG